MKTVSAAILTLALLAGTATADVLSFNPSTAATTTTYICHPSPPPSEWSPGWRLRAWLKCHRR